MLLAEINLENLMRWAFVVPLIMACSFLFHLLFSKKLQKRFGEKAVSAVGVFAIGVCFVLSLAIGVGWIQRVNSPPTGAAFTAAEEACKAPYGEAGAEGHGTETGGATEGHGGETKTEAPGASTEGHGGETKPEAPAAGHEGAAGIAPGESASAALLTQAEGEGHTSEAPAGGETKTEAKTEAPAAGGEGHGAEGAAAEGEGHGAEGEHHEVAPVCSSVTWFEIGGMKFEAGTVVDGLSAMMLVTVTLISLLVHIYSIEYLHGDVRFTHYYAFLSLFSASMLFYVLSSNTLQMLTGWELVGVCSFALIGHWWEEKKNTDAALKAFLTNRVGDTGLIIGVIITFFAAGAKSFNVFHINEYALSNGADKGLLFLGALCLFFGVTSKSGQFPLHTWLPDAMAGPTPVSALIHAATMVVAGVYLVARMFPTFFVGMQIGVGGNWAPVGNYVAIIGATTALIGAGLAFVQYDLKKVLAYSTVSQLGYMILGLGVGAWTGAIFHLFTHAMFKACLFLGAGSCSHAAHHTFDMREMGGLKKYMPITQKTFLACTFALSGLPLMSGFWSKDEILAGAAQGQGGKPYMVMLVIGLVVGGMTASYMTRAYRMTFLDDYRGHGHPHESPKVMTVPLMILTVLAFFATFLNIPKLLLGGETSSLAKSFGVRFEHYVQPTFIFPGEELLKPAPFNVIVAGLSMAAALGGYLIMRQYMTAGIAKGAAAKPGIARGIYSFLENKYYLDALYENVIRDGVKGPIARASYWVNMNIIDGMVNAVGVSARKVGEVTYKYVDQGGIDGLVNGTGAVSNEGGQLLRRVFATGKVQQYGAWLFGGAVVFAALIVLFVK